MTPPESVMEALREGLKAKAGGEVLVRGGNGVGRVYIHNGGIAWVTCDKNPTRLRHVLETHGNIASDTLNAVVEECQKKRTNIAETLLAWGVLDKATLRSCLLFHNANHMRAIVALTPPLASMFLPQERRYTSDFLFSIEELTQAARSTATTPQSPPAATVTPLVVPAGRGALTTALGKLAHCLALATYDLKIGKLVDVATGPTQSREQMTASAAPFVALWTSSPISALTAKLANTNNPDVRIMRQWLAVSDTHIFFAYVPDDQNDTLVLAVYEAGTSIGHAMGMTRAVLATAGA